MRLRKGGEQDGDRLLAMFDDAVAWLAGRGLAGQWGGRRWSERDRTMSLVRELAGEDGFWIAEADGEPAGALVLTRQPPGHVPPLDPGRLYVSLLLTARKFTGRGVGAVLLDHARSQARRQGLTGLQLDCWAGGDRRLVDYYIRAGFTPTSAYDVNGRPEQRLEQRFA